MRRILGLAVVGAALSLGCGWADTPLTLSGQGTVMSAPIHLDGRPVKLTWTTYSGDPCSGLILQLYEVPSGAPAGYLANGQFGETWIYGKSGDFALSIGSSCQRWIVNLGPAG